MLMKGPSRAAVLVAAALAPLARWAGAQELVTIKTASSPLDVVTPMLWGIKSGMFRRAGLDVSLEAMQSGAAAAAAVAGGTLQVALSSVPSLIAAHVRSIPFTLIAPGGLYQSEAPFTLMLARKVSTIRSGRDMTGKTVGVLALNDVFTLGNKAWIDETGGDYRSAKFVEMPTSALLPALLDGRVDVVSLAVPALSEALATGKVRVVAKPYDGMGKRLETTAWFTTEEYVARNRDAVDRLVRVLHEAALYANAHQRDTADVLAAFTGIDAKLIARTQRMVHAEYLDARMIQPLIDASVKYRLIERGFNAQEFISPAALKAS
jgi:NitT/TauT family transport system substrate-binding protein